MYLLRFFKKALFHPDQTNYSYSVVRTFLAKPIVFDLVSMFLQVFSMSRLAQAISKNNESDNHFQDVFEYNAEVTGKKQIATTRRPEEYFRILSACSTDVKNKKILLIGPRNVFELYIAWLYGFKWNNIEAIDLFSTHHKIKIMNMEQMTFPDESFDYVLLSRVYGYSKDPEGFIKGISRILKTGGKVVFEANYVPEDDRWPTNRISGKETIKYLNKADLNISYYKYYEKINALKNRQASHLIAATKIDNKKQALDRINFISQE